MQRKNKKEKKKSNLDFIHTGSYLLNLATSSDVDGGWARGRIINLVGDGSSGKTLLALEACAQAFYGLKDVKKKTIVYNNVEGVMDFPVEEMYGNKFKEAIEFVRFETVEEFGRDYLKRVKTMKKDDFLLYVMDSLDAASSSAARQRTEDSIRKGKDEEGTYGMEKAKYLSSSFFPRACSEMENKDATLICISQVRDNINAGLFGAKHSRIGGKALDFYTHQVCWLAVVKKLTKEYKGTKRVYGVRVRAKLNRNKVAKPFRECDFDILFDYGVDDIGSLIQYLYGTAREMSWDGEEVKRKEFIRLIEESKQDRKKLVSLVAEEWQEIEDQTKPERAKRFQ